MSTIEPEITEKLARRKRPLPEDFHEDNSIPSSSQPLPLLSAADSYTDSRKRVRALSSSELERNNMHVGWLQNNRQASPITEQSETYNGLEDSPMFDAPSTPELDGRENGPTIQEPSSSIVSSSPPRTPPPNRRNLANTKQAGADLLLYLANSPRTPAVHVHHISSTQKQPTTPTHGLPSSVMHTPGAGLFNGSLNTPGNFNLSEFCNVTPSPGQAQFGRQSTPAIGRTPLRSTRRSLNFDALLPPSPTDRSKSRGLALNLGEELN